MSKIKPFSPFRNLERWSPWRDFDESFWPPWARQAQLQMDLPAEIKLDVSEDEQNYHVKAELPGVNKDDIHVSIDGNQVSITAETRSEKEEKGKNTIRRERYYGKQYRSFMLASDVDDSKSQAQYKDGILELTLPKRAGGGAKKLTVN